MFPWRLFWSIEVWASICVFLCPRGLGPPGAQSVRVVCMCVCVYVRPSVDQVNIFVQGRISRPINGSNLIFHIRVYLRETSRNMQEPWPYDLYFTVHWLQTLARLSRLTFLSKVESQDLLMVASWYFIWGCISMRPAEIYKSHDLMIYISRSTDFRLWPDYQG